MRSKIGMTMDPKSWDADEVARSLIPDTLLCNNAGVSGTGRHGMVVGSTGPFASLAGRAALQSGGTAVDAAIATALTQIALAAGSWVSYAGVFSLVYYQAGTNGQPGQTYSLSAGFSTFAAEDDPSSIPAAPQRSGRTALVPGFMSGAQAAHDRFGALPWAELFTPAIHVAAHGFRVGAVRARQFDLRADVLPASFRARAGDTFRQPDLERTLRAVADEGAEYMYLGRWAHRFVDAVNQAGGKATLADLLGYRPIWSDPVRCRMGDYEVHAMGAPDVGGTRLVSALRRAEGLGDPLIDPKALAELIRICDDDEPGSHSDFVLAADEAGNVAAVCHSINTSIWGSTGLFVDGISIPDAASFQQAALAKLAPGQHLPFVANPAIALRDGRAVLASSSIGAGLHPVTVQCLHAALGLGVPLDQVVRRPLFHGPDNLAGDTVNTPLTVRDSPSIDQPAGDVAQAQVVEDGFDAEILCGAQELGQRLAIRPTSDWSIPRGYWGGIHIGDVLTGGRTGFVDGSVEGL